jgi:7,8-dihydropterin-6-yl-methyl-4-(beta-D-ribofuranosyl)aminobenzene 5'-phosphate synthase
MTAAIRITCLINDAQGPVPLPVEHGLSFLIECERGTLLFDTGQTGLVVENARHLGLDPSRADRIVLSHGHDDHTGGLDAWLNVVPRGTLFLHPAALEHKYSWSTGECRDIGMPNLTAETIAQRGWNVVQTLTRTEVADGLHVTGPIPRGTNFEDVGGSFFLDTAKTRPDPMLDDQALFFPTRQGIVVLLGCAHAGVINTLDYVRKLTRGTPLHAVIGGLHLLNASPDRLAATLAALRHHAPHLLAPCHCTGTPATDLLRHHFPHQLHPCGTGSQFTFD